MLAENLMSACSWGTETSALNSAVISSTCFMHYTGFFMARISPSLPVLCDVKVRTRYSILVRIIQWRVMKVRIAALTS